MDLMEHVRRPLVGGVKLTVPGRAVMEGTMCISAFYLIYSTRQQASADEITVLHTAIDHTDHKPGTTAAAIFLKDFRKYSFEFQSPDECQDMVDALDALSRPERLQQLHVFTYHPRHPLPSCPWHFASCQELMSRWQCPAEMWRVSDANGSFQLCSSYPREVIVPAAISDDDLQKVAPFRHLGRFPVLSFHHRRNKAVLLRCGQPLCGTGQKRCKEDVQLLNASLLGLNRGKIVDIRSQSVAQSHMTKGGGIELPAHYPQWRVEYARMEYPPSILASLNKLVEACNDPALATSSSWFGRLEASGWLTHVSRLLNAARVVALYIHRDANSVVVHGAGSRDATLQVTSLAQVLLDPHCRTVEGFAELIQREWLDGGHPFSLRHNHVTSAPEKEKAPTFLMFVDAVWQVTQQYPLSFEFNECFLHTLFSHSYFSVYGTFLYDTPRERYKQKLDDSTHSLWTYLAQRDVLEPMLNPLYERNSSVLIITVHALNVTLWKRMYLCSAELPGVEALQALCKKNLDLRHKLSHVRRELRALQGEGRKFVSNWT